MDRVDVSPDGRHARVLDYKTGRIRSPKTPDRLVKGRALQLILDAIPRTTGGERDRLRELALAIFNQLGAGNPTRVSYRRRLATALY